MGPRGRSYAVAADGRFLLALTRGETTAPRIEVITNFGAMLDRLAPPRKP